MRICGSVISLEIVQWLKALLSSFSASLAIKKKMDHGCQLRSTSLCHGLTYCFFDGELRIILSV